VRTVYAPFQCELALSPYLQGFCNPQFHTHELRDLSLSRTSSLTNESHVFNYNRDLSRTLSDGVNANFSQPHQLEAARYLCTERGNLQQFVAHPNLPDFGPKHLGHSSLRGSTDFSTQWVSEGPESLGHEPNLYQGFPVLTLASTGVLGVEPGVPSALDGFDLLPFDDPIRTSESAEPFSFSSTPSSSGSTWPAPVVQTSTCRWSGCHEALDHTLIVTHWKEYHLIPINQLWKAQPLGSKHTFCLWNGCHKEFKRPSDLDRHVQSIHFSVHSNCRVIGCSNNRGHGFSRPDKLRDHEKKAHSMH
jgi:hypothetical protein